MVHIRGKGLVFSAKVENLRGTRRLLCGADVKNGKN